MVGYGVEIYWQYDDHYYGCVVCEITQVVKHVTNDADWDSENLVISGKTWPTCTSVSASTANVPEWASDPPPS